MFTSGGNGNQQQQQQQLYFQQQQQQQHLLQQQQLQQQQQQLQQQQALHEQQQQPPKAKAVRAKRTPKMAADTLLAPPAAAMENGEKKTRATPIQYSKLLVEAETNIKQEHKSAVRALRRAQRLEKSEKRLQNSYIILLEEHLQWLKVEKGAADDRLILWWLSVFENCQREFVEWLGENIRQRLPTVWCDQKITQNVRQRVQNQATVFSEEQICRDIQRMREERDSALRKAWEMDIKTRLKSQEEADALLDSMHELQSRWELDVLGLEKIYILLEKSNAKRIGDIRSAIEYSYTAITAIKPLVRFLENYLLTLE